MGNFVLIWVTPEGVNHFLSITVHYMDSNCVNRKFTSFKIMSVLFKLFTDGDLTAEMFMTIAVLKL